MLFPLGMYSKICPSNYFPQPNGKIGQKIAKGWVLHDNVKAGRSINYVLYVNTRKTKLTNCCEILINMKESMQYEPFRIYVIDNEDKHKQ